MFNKKTKIEMVQNMVHVEVFLKNGEKKVVTFYDSIQLNNGKFSVAINAISLFYMTKEKHPNIARMWSATDGTYLLEKNIASFGNISEGRRNQVFEMKQNIFTKKLSWA